jgi:hypothetical protein
VLVSDPYRPASSTGQDVLRAARSRSPGRWALGGFGIGAGLPAGLGIYGIYQFNAYVASLPPDTFVCGNGVLGAYALIFVIAPGCGMIGAAVGWAIAATNRPSLRDEAMQKSPFTRR